MTAFRAVLREQPDGVEVVLHGELDMAGVPRLEASLPDELRGRVTVDLRQLTFADSTALSFFIKLHRAAEADGFQLKLIPGPPNVHRAFEITGLDRLLPLDGSSG